MEILITLVALAAFASVFAIGHARRERTMALLAALGITGVVATAAAFGSFGPPPAKPAPPGPIQVLDDGYVSSDRCRACHPSQYESWHRSFHRTMTQPGTLEAVAAPLDGEPIVAWGQEYRLFERDGQPWAEIPDPAAPESRQDRSARRPASGPRVERPVTLVTGSHHYQVYWVPASDDPDTRDVTAIPVVWRIDGQRWIPRSAAFLMSPTLNNRELPWSLVCIKCHATRGRPGVDLETDYVELGISCEACHGPGEQHIAFHQDPVRRYGAHLGDADDPTIVDPIALEGSRGSEICAQCHSLFLVEDSDRYIEEGTPFRPGDAIATHFPSTRGEHKSEAQREQMFWSDGEVRTTGREWVSMTQSRCHERGQLGCMDCHSMHEGSRDDQLDDSRGGDGGCASCHDPGAYASESHTHHEVGSSGASCLNCHMPYTAYGLLKSVRTHRISSPDVGVTLATGRPSACNLCHLDRTLAWTQDQLVSWFEHERVELPPLRAKVADAVFLTLAGDAGQRALAVDAMGWAPAQAASDRRWMAPFLGLSLNDPYDAVRQIAYRSLRTLPGFGEFRYDALAPDELRVETAVDVIPDWFEANREDIASMPDTIPIDPVYGFDRPVLEALLRSRDNRMIMLTE